MTEQTSPHKLWENEKVCRQAGRQPVRWSVGELRLLAAGTPAPVHGGEHGG